MHNDLHKTNLREFQEPYAPPIEMGKHDNYNYIVYSRFYFCRVTNRLLKLPLTWFSTVFAIVFNIQYVKASFQSCIFRLNHHYYLHVEVLWLSHSSGCHGSQLNRVPLRHAIWQHSHLHNWRLTIKV